MKFKGFYTSSSFVLKTAFFVFAMMSLNIFAQGQTVTFAQFIERNGTQDFVFTNNATSASLGTIANGSPVLFTYQNVLFLPPELQGPQLAHIFITSNTTTPATQSMATPPRDNQQFDQTVTIEIIRDTQAVSGTGTRRNLLTAVITPIGA